MEANYSTNEGKLNNRKSYMNIWSLLPLAGTVLTLLLFTLATTWHDPIKRSRNLLVRDGFGNNVRHHQQDQKEHFVGHRIMAAEDKDEHIYEDEHDSRYDIGMKLEDGGSNEERLEGHSEIDNEDGIITDKDPKQEFSNEVDYEKMMGEENDNDEQHFNSKVENEVMDKTLGEGHNQSVPINVPSGTNDVDYIMPSKSPDQDLDDEVEIQETANESRAEHNNLLRFRTSAQYVEFRSKQNTAYCLDVKGASTDNFTPLQLYRCNGTPAQRFYKDSSGRLRSQLNSNLCVEMDPNYDVFVHSACIDQWYFFYYSNQASKGTFLKNLGDDRCISSPSSSITNWTPVVRGSCGSSNSNAGFDMVSVSASGVATDGAALPLLFHGRLVDDGGAPIPNAYVQFWQTDTRGIYDHPRFDVGFDAAGDSTDLDPSFQYFGTASTDADGAFFFKTYRPGIYAARPITHIHYKVWIWDGDDLNLLLISQFYFKDEGHTRFSPLLQLELSYVMDDKGGSTEVVTRTNKTIAVNMRRGGSEPLTPWQQEGPYYPVVDFFGYDNDLTNAS